MSDSVRPHRRQPTRLPCPWDSPGKNTGVGCHFLLQCVKVKSESEVTQSCLTLCDPMDCSLPGSSVHGIFPGKSTRVGSHRLLRYIHYYAEYIVRNAGLEEAHAGIKIARRNINNLRYADDTTLMAESEEELKNPLDESESGECVESGESSTFRKLRSWHPVPSLHGK